jgi:thiol-disulfide isomerase/thioredoxin
MGLTVALVASLCVSTALGQKSDTSQKTTAKDSLLGVGDAAPGLEVKSFVKGEPVSTFEPGKIYVVEFWATWCGPCRTSIPHLTELQKKYEKVSFIGVSVWESDQSKVKPFVEEMGDKMAYRVAIDAVPEGGQRNEGAMAKTWMTAAGQNGIPTAFVVDTEGKIAWIGHPMSMDEPLEKITTGKWDLKEAAASHKKAMEERVKAMKVQSKLVEAIRTKDPKKIIAAVDEIVVDVPGMEANYGRFKLSALIKLDQQDQALEYADKLSKTELGKSAQGLNALAWFIVDPDSDAKPGKKLVEFARETAQRADEMAGGKDAGIADTLAKACFDSGETAKAVEHQERAIKLAKGSPYEAQIDQLKERLEKYKKAAAKP